MQLTEQPVEERGDSRAIVRDKKVAETTKYHTHGHIPSWLTGQKLVVFPGLETQKEFSAS